MADAFEALLHGFEERRAGPGPHVLVLQEVDRAVGQGCVAFTGAFERSEDLVDGIAVPAGPSEHDGEEVAVG